ncbi:hypothetical protein NST44_01795 [Paenibacillus sp. FSL W8-0919]|uniref:hypothetical protein n=1 Tax=Paenibacillus sp. FSL W8-0919 TaxID=2954707 RepID=UPI0030F69A2D
MKHLDEKMFAAMRTTQTEGAAAEEAELVKGAAVGTAAGATANDAPEGPNALGPVDVERAFLRIGDEIVPFQTVHVLDGKLSLRLPKTFRIMPEELARLKYPSEHRPGLIYTDETHTVNLAFNLTSTPLNQEELEDFQEALTRMLRSTQPIERWMGEGMETVDGRKAGTCAFVIPTLTSSVFNLMFYSDLEDKALLCTFNCLESDMNDWKPVAEAMLRSMKWEHENDSQLPTSNQGGVRV